MNLSDARNEMFEALKTAWSLALLTAEIYWQGRQEKNAPDTSLPYARATVLHSVGRQATLSNASGARLWERGGIVVVQCFGPLSSGRGLDMAEQMAQVAKNTFEGKSTPGGIWFRNCRCAEVGPSDGWFQINAVAEFLYDEVR